VTRTVSATAEQWPIAGAFRIARGAKTSAEVVVVTVNDGEFSGQGECLPYARYGETTGATIDAIRRVTPEQLTRPALLEALPAGAARNALDCALWDLEAKRTATPVWQLARLAEPRPVVTAFTLSLDEVEVMRAAASRQAQRPLLKLKLGADPDTDIKRLRAVRGAAPDTRLIVDANEGWSIDALKIIAPIASHLGVELLEQPLPADHDSALIDYTCPVALGADESMLDATDLVSLAKKYQVVNVKLDKTGGLSRAIHVVEHAQTLGLEIMIGCMVATSLSMAPALLLAQTAKFVDLDGPLLLARDRDPGLVYDNNTVRFPVTPFWGFGG
jgi:L-alanine-DL-glutamate epimerase-like enolase superfamily enzyme